MRFFKTLIPAMLIVAQPAYATLFQGELISPGSTSTRTFVVPKLIEDEPSRVRIRTISYGGGTSVSEPDKPGGFPKKIQISHGGFDPIMVVRDSDGQILAQVDDASVPGTQEDPNTGLTFDSAVDLMLDPGTYTLEIAMFDNFEGSGVSCCEGFDDVSESSRTNKWAVELITIRDLINNTVAEPLDGVDFASTKAKFRLADAIGVSNGTVIQGVADFGGFDHFNWYQTIDAIRGTRSCRSTGPDPEIGGNCKSSYDAWFTGVFRSDEAQANFQADNFKWYWDEVSLNYRTNLFVDSNTSSDQLEFFDQPGGFDVGGVIEFTTILVGVKQGDEAVVFAEPTFHNTAFKWRWRQTSKQYFNVIGEDAGIVENVHFFQNGFQPEVGGSVEFAGYLTASEWSEVAEQLMAQGIEVVGLDGLTISLIPSQYQLNEGVLTGPGVSESIEALSSVRLEFSHGGFNFKVNIDLHDLIDQDGEEGHLLSPVAALLNKISDLYVAFFNRAPDPAGLMYWFSEIYKGNLSLQDTAKSFTQQVEYFETYPPGLGNREFIQKIYQNLFDREPDLAGWNYWENDLNNGLSRDIFILAIINGAYGGPSAEDKALLNNKHQASMYYTEQLTLNPDMEFDDDIVEVLNRVTADEATVDSAIAVIDYLMENKLIIYILMQDIGLWDSFWP